MKEKDWLRIYHHINKLDTYFFEVRLNKCGDLEYGLECEGHPYCRYMTLDLLISALDRLATGGVGCIN